MPRVGPAGHAPAPVLAGGADGPCGVGGQVGDRHCLDPAVEGVPRKRVKVSIARIPSLKKVQKFKTDSPGYRRNSVLRPSPAVSQENEEHLSIQRARTRGKEEESVRRM